MAAVEMERSGCVQRWHGQDLQMDENGLSNWVNGSVTYRDAGILRKE